MRLRLIAIGREEGFLRRPSGKRLQAQTPPLTVMVSQSAREGIPGEMIRQRLIGPTWILAIWDVWMLEPSHTETARLAAARWSETSGSGPSRPSTRFPGTSWIPLTGSTRLLGLVTAR